MANTILDTFMAAIRRLESGSFEGDYFAQGPIVKSGMYEGYRAIGAYQIMQNDWNWRANTAGLPGADIRDPAAQDAVARYWFTKYYEKYQDWNLVAVAWFGGTGAADIAQEKGLSATADRADDTGTTVPDYVKLINKYLLEAAQDTRYAPSPAVTGTYPTPESTGGYGQALAKPAQPLTASMLEKLLSQWGMAGIMPTTYQATVSDPNENLAALMATLNPDAGETAGRVTANIFAQGLKSMSGAVQNRSGVNLSSVDYSQLRIKPPGEENE